MKSVSFRINLFQSFCVLVIGLFACLFALEQIYNFDMWWHLRSGTWMLSEGAIPHYDTFSFSTNGAKWINSSWLSGLVFIMLNQLGGLDLLILFKALLIGLSFAGAGLFLIRRGVNPYIVLLLLGWAVVVARFRFLLRPQLFMFPGLVILFWILSKTATNNKPLAFLVVPLTVLWVNLHGSAYIAPVFGLFLVSEVILQKKIHSDKIEKTETSLPFALTLFVSLCVAILLTPYGVDLLRFVVERAVVGDLVTGNLSVEEHLPLKWGTRNGYWALLIATGLSFIPVFGRVRLFYLFSFLGTVFLSLNSVRYVGLAAVIQAMILGLNLQQIVDRTPLRALFETKVYRIVGFIVLIAVGCFAFQSTFTSEKIYQWGFGVNQSRYPVAEVDYLKRIQFKGNLYNSWETGGYILWHLPQVRTVIDGRVLPEQLVLKDKLDAMSLSAFSNYLTKNDVHGALLGKQDALNVQRFDGLPQFQLKSFSEKFLVYVRNDFSFPAGTDQTVSFKYVQPQSYDVSYLVPLALGPQSKEVEEELKRAVAMSPENFTLLFQYGIFLEAMNRQEALDLYLKAAKANPSLGFSHFKLGLQAGRFALKHRKWEYAISILQQALEHGTGKSEHYFFLGTAFYQKKIFPEAQKAYLNALSLKPDHIATLQNLGFIYIDMGQFEEAESHFEKVLDLAPGSESAQYGYALALDKQMRPEADKAWKKFLQAFPGSRWADNARRNLQK